jgi:mRNA interferase HigB
LIGWHAQRECCGHGWSTRLIPTLFSCGETALADFAICEIIEWTPASGSRYQAGKTMHVISRRKLREFWEEHPDAETPLSAWYKTAKKAQWQKFADVRAEYPSADQVGKCIVFNIGGNKYRLIVIISPNWRKVYVRFVLTHKDYDQGGWKHDCAC